jgi:threonine dehydratase/serine racemase
MTEYATNLHEIREASERIDPHIHRTPILTSHSINDLLGTTIFFKCENFQKGGAFKARGALNAVLQLSDEEAARGIVTHSSGNHAQAVALAARLRGVSAKIVMPNNASTFKRVAVEGYGGEIHLCEPTHAAREAMAAELLAATGGTLVPPFDHPHILAGQGTVGVELDAQLDELDAVVVPIGGGGLLSGVALAMRELRPKLAIFAAEPAGADDAARSVEKGERLPQTDPQTIADGLRTGIGSLTWPVLRDLVEGVPRVAEAQIRQAMRMLFERMKIVVEPSGAVGLGACLSDPRLMGKRIAVVLTGGNVAPADFARLLEVEEKEI